MYYDPNEFGPTASFPQNIFDLLADTLEKNRKVNSVPSGFVKSDVIELENQIVIKCDIPGVGKDNIKIALDGPQLRIYGERKIQVETAGIQGRYSGSFDQTFTVPIGTKPEDVLASYEDGVLTVTIEKRAPVKTEHLIQIN